MFVKKEFLKKSQKKIFFDVASIFRMDPKKPRVKRNIQKTG